jgi:hypothetical protein
MKKLILILFSIFIVVFLYSETKIFKANDDDEIKIVQISNTKFQYYNNNMLLFNSTRIRSVISDVPDALVKYNKAHLNFIGSSTLLGLGIGFSCFNTPLTLAFTLSSILMPHPAFIGCAAGFGVFFIGSLVMWISGAINRSINRVKEAEAIEYYNDIKRQNKNKLNLNLDFDIYLDNHFNPSGYLCFAIQI